MIHLNLAIIYGSISLIYKEKKVTCNFPNLKYTDDTEHTSEHTVI
ncbi:hypothetical protein RchiOBHm_Chr2g0124971 [Rosa chinensis]|uniref:Uncharacterized protein n=1 Tax=Rosa chinensis TaxID=74649 RepID=A0A2P6RTH8_ROSCH|nr:hypothetical protein RchiOBHm_Chr2g0124971 [Rosa chinensis]